MNLIPAINALNKSTIQSRIRMAKLKAHNKKSNPKLEKAYKREIEDTANRINSIGCAIKILKRENKNNGTGNN